MALADAAEPHGSSWWPRCLQVLANARTCPSSPRTSSAPPFPVSTASWSPAAGSRDPWAAHVQPPPKKCRRSQSNTSADVYAAGGSIRLSPNGSSAVASAAGSTGAGGKARGDSLFTGPEKS